MRITVALLLIALVILLSSKRETYQEVFGYSGYSDPITGIVLNDKPIDKSITDLKKLRWTTIQYKKSS